MIREIIMSFMSAILQSLTSTIKMLGEFAGVEVLVAIGVAIVLLLILVNK